jgi:hypothetical protein
MSVQQPAVGRIVHYVLPENRRHAGEIRAAIITRAMNPCTAEIHPGMSNLAIVLDGANDLDEANWAGSVMYDPTGRPGTWHWPERS